jgi:hypothetical protein
MTLPRLCIAVGLPLDLGARSVDHRAWDGHVLRGRRADGEPWGDDRLWHEVSHWLLAPPALRVYAGFGLGMPPHLEGDPALWGPEVAHDACETQAILLARRIGTAHGYAMWLGYDPRGTAWDRAMAVLAEAGVAT